MKAALSTLLILASMAPAFAAGGSGGTPGFAAPEISALDGAAALAVVAAVVLLVWERRRAL